MLRGFAYGMIMVLACSSCGCREVTKTVAERCVLVDLQQKRGRELIPDLEELARAWNLAIDRSHPLEVRLYRGSIKRPRAELGYRIGLGEFGAALSAFRFDPEQDADLLQLFDRFVAERVAPKYGTKQCTEVPGFQLPIVYR